MRALRELGVQLAIDDFGTGYSSLAYLKQLPGRLAEDRPLLRRRAARRPARPVDHRGDRHPRPSRLGLTVVAEGVETVEQWIALDELGCTVGQGFLWSPPIPARAFAPLITGLRRAARATPGSPTTT